MLQLVLCTSKLSGNYENVNCGKKNNTEFSLSLEITGPTETFNTKITERVTGMLSVFKE